MVLDASDATRAANALRQQLKDKLGDKKSSIRQWCSNDGSITIENFCAGVQDCGIRSSPVVMNALFRMLSNGSSKISVRDLQRCIFGTTRKPVTAKGSAVALAVDMGVMLAETSADERAKQLEFAKRPTYSEIDRFAWEAPAANAAAQPQPTDSLPYMLAGDPRFDTPEALERRVNLLKSGRVVRACRQFWDTMQLGADDVVDRATYEDVHRLLTRALAPQMGEDEWREAVNDDWRDDLRSHEAMSMPLYLMSIFEVADLWTDSCEEWQVPSSPLPCASRSFLLCCQRPTLTDLPLSLLACAVHCLHQQALQARHQAQGEEAAQEAVASGGRSRDDARGSRCCC